METVAHLMEFIMKKNNLILLTLCTTVFYTTYPLSLTSLVVCTKQEQAERQQKKDALEKVNLHGSCELTRMLKKLSTTRYFVNLFKHLALNQEEIN